MTMYAIFYLMSVGVYVQTDIPMFKSSKECEARVAELNDLRAKCMEVVVAKKNFKRY